MNRTWLRRMIWSYIPIFCIIFSFVFFMFFQTLVEQNNENTKESSKVFTRQLLQSIDVSLKSVDYMIIREIMNNKLFSDFFGEKDSSNVYLNYQVVKKLEALKQEVPFISSYYLVRNSDRLVFSGNVIRNLDDFEDAPFIRDMQSSDSKSPWTDLRMYREFSFQKQKEVVSLVHKVPLSQGSEGLFVVNISVASLQDNIMDMYDPQTAFVNLYDRNGNTLFKQDGLPEESEVLAHVSSEYTNWTAESGVYNGKLVNVVSNFSGVWLLFGLLVFAAGVVSIIYVTRKNYKPLEELVVRINDNLFQDKHTLGRVAVNEFAFIESAINNFAEQSKAFKRESELAALERRRTFFTQLINGESSSSELTFPPHSLIQVLIIEIDQAEQSFNRYQTRDQALFKFVLSSVTHEMMSRPEVHIWLEWTASLQLTGIVFLEDPAARLDEVCEGIVSWLNKNLAFTATIGIGESTDSRHGISESYKEALESLKFKAVMGNNRIIRLQEARSVSDKESSKHLKAIHNLVQSFRCSNDLDWRADYLQWFDGIRKCCLSKSEIVEQGRYFMAHMDLHMSQISKDYYEIWTASALPQARQSIGEFDTLDELQQALLGILENYSERMAVLREERQYHSSMKKVREYIERHYANPELSLDYLSDQFSINAKYLSQLFKDEFGENFLDFLAEVRIRHAKRWLLEQSSSIQDIGERVGYVNAATFRRVFRRVEGVSPMDYRKLHTREQTG
ncbi:helix-turn-helix domain-containing protein [Paenibacillus spongiae]|uniref:Helix-turn-helix domain-containing protein n=1 Tax=Paenibacillus spongiae TaxID=2909671 RepID=A0ABY5SK68_9BACL|nr:helix-turn-helix domain-containing protein [Paenibacillus spongiae]UVI32638.1 helix-turn-helix domain-containing protein [Paenibacillus spongiae]